MSDGKVKKNDKQLLWRIHHWAGLYAGIVIGVLSLTGALAVFIPEIDALIVRYHYDVRTAAPVTGDLHIENTIDSLTRRFPAYSSLTINLPQESHHPAYVGLIVRPVGSAIQHHTFFVDTGTDRILAERNHQNSLANYLRQIHVRLYEGNWGRQLVGLGGVALLVLAVTGLLIYRNFMKKQAWPEMRKKAGMRIVMADWHKLLGISALAFNLVIAITGAWLGLQPWLMKWFDMKTPNAYKAAVVMTPEADKSLTIDWTEVYASMRREFPELQPSDISLSTDGSGSLLIRGNIPGLVYESNINMLVLSKEGHSVLYKYDVRHKPFSHKLYFVQEALHFGDFGGLLLKAVYTFLGLVSGFLSISGFAIYLYRRKKKQPEANPMKLTFVYTIIVLLFLVMIALISLFIGYSQAATMAAIIINTLLITLPLYALGRYFVDRYRKNKNVQPI